MLQSSNDEEEAMTMRKAYIILGGIVLLAGGFLLGRLIGRGAWIGFRPWLWSGHMPMLRAWTAPWMFGFGWPFMALLWLVPVGLLVALIVLLARRRA
jgi:hypothetical protein